jgi:hypothetical protein
MLIDIAGTGKKHNYLKIIGKGGPGTEHLRLL